MNETIKKSRKRYSPEFKDQVLAKAKSEGVAQVARDLDIAESMIYYWRSQAKKSGTTLEQHKLEQAEFARMQRELRKLKQENEFLKKAAAYFAEESKRGTE
jgi:transposase